jgi:hypothetical protein
MTGRRQVDELEAAIRASGFRAVRRRQVEIQVRGLCDSCD